MIKFFFKYLLVIAVLGGIGYAAYAPINRYIAERNLMSRASNSNLRFIQG